MFSPVRLNLPGKRVCFWGAPARVDIQADSPTSWSEKLDKTGGNTGNLFIGRGFFENTDAAEKVYHPGFGQVSPSQFDELFDYLFIPASNFINPALDLQGVYDYFRQTSVPIVCFGLGSQVVPGKELVLKPGTEAFIRLISERSGSIGVRGSYTAEILWNLGIRNLSLTGCPSLLGLDDLTVQTLVETHPTLEKIAVNFSNNVRGHSFNPEAQRLTENALFQDFMTRKSFYILQNEAVEFSIMDALEKGNMGLLDRHLTSAAKLFNYDASPAELRRLAEKLRVFFKIDDWIGSMRTMTASIGTRFHGNIASILAGTPAMVLVHDMRTRELAELFSIPHIILDRYYPAEELLERLQAVDYAPFATRLGQLRAEWNMFIERNGLLTS